MVVPGGVKLHLVSGVALLRPDEQVFEAMLDGWRNQQLARNLQFSTIEQRENTVRAFVTATNTYPWNWSPQLVDEWLGDGRAVRGIKHTTVRNYQNALRLFCVRRTERIRQGAHRRHGRRFDRGPSGDWRRRVGVHRRRLEARRTVGCGHYREHGLARDR